MYSTKTYKGKQILNDRNYIPYEVYLEKYYKNQEIKCAEKENKLGSTTTTTTTTTKCNVANKDLSKFGKSTVEKKPRTKRFSSDGSVQAAVERIEGKIKIKGSVASK